MTPKADNMRRTMPRMKQDILAFVILILAVSLFHASGIRPGRTFLPVDLANLNLPWRDGSIRTLQNWLISDPLYQFFPFLVNATETIRHMGQWPIWNPRILLGHPVLADPLAQVFYPVFIALGLAFGAARRAGHWVVVTRDLGGSSHLWIPPHHRLPLACCDLGRAHVRSQRLSGNLVRNHLLDKHTGLDTRYPLGV